MDNSKFVVDALFLCNQSEYHRQYSLLAFNHNIIYPLLHKRLRIYYENNKPVSLVTWCWLTKEQGELFLKDEYSPEETDYQRDIGEQLWGIEFIAPYGHAAETMRLIRKEFHQTYDFNAPVHWRRTKSPDKMHKRIF
jgi:cytolysin-activating lysine-acyltransferase